MRPPHLSVLALSALLYACQGTPPVPAGPTAADTAQVAPNEPDSLHGGVEQHVKEVKGSTLVFADGSTYDTGLKGLQVAGDLDVPGGKGRTLLLADHEVDGLSGKALFLLDRAPEARTRNLAHAWSAPGEKLDGETGEAFLKVLVYYGTVLPDTNGVIWYEEALMPDGQWRKNTTLLYDGPHGTDTLVFFGKGRLASTQMLAFAGKCKELKGTAERQAP